MELLHDASQILGFESTIHVVDNDVIGKAYGPHFKSGLSAYSVYNVKRDGTTNQLYIETEDGKEILNADGSVHGNTNKIYNIAYK